MLHPHTGGLIPDSTLHNLAVEKCRWVPGREREAAFPSCRGRCATVLSRRGGWPFPFSTVQAGMTGQSRKAQAQENRFIAMRRQAQAHGAPGGTVVEGGIVFN